MDPFTNYYGCDNLVNIDNLKSENINVDFYGNVIKNDEFEYSFYLVKQENNEHINLKLEKKMIHRININHEDDIYITIHNDAKNFINKLEEIDNYFSNHLDFKGYNYVPITRTSKYGSKYIKCKLLLDYQTNNILTNYSIQDIFTDEIFYSHLDSISQFKKVTNNVKQMIIFPNKLWKHEETKEYGFSLRIKDIIVTN
jgi:hypothetical protein